MDLSKYVPPMFASQMSALIPSGPSVFPLPPLPERIEGMAQVRAAARVRDDDLIDGGVVDPRDVQRTLMLVTDIAGEYGRLYTAFAEQAPVEAEEATEALPSVDVDDLLISVMSDAEKVGRIAKLTGTVRYAVEGGDSALLAETIREIQRVARHLGDQYRIDDLIRAAQQPSSEGGRRAELLLQRCYKLAAEAYAEVREIDAQLEQLDR